MTENRPKLTCSKFFEKFKIVFFGFFSKRCLKMSSEGTKNNQKKYQVVFEKFPNLCSKNRKKTNPQLGYVNLRAPNFRFSK